ncbi:hypothetical protein SynPROSU1_02040 [Synechococcus sp. PROS-U-1]|nr:hypothetical protein SynPROSU1_02040 [Synechococcus sp. PROS-U-1]
MAGFLLLEQSGEYFWQSRLTNNATRKASTGETCRVTIRITGR